MMAATPVAVFLCVCVFSFCLHLLFFFCRTIRNWFVYMDISIFKRTVNVRLSFDKNQRHFSALYSNIELILSFSFSLSLTSIWWKWICGLWTLFAINVFILFGRFWEHCSLHCIVLLGVWHGAVFAVNFGLYSPIFDCWASAGCHHHLIDANTTNNETFDRYTQ